MLEEYYPCPIKTSYGAGTTQAIAPRQLATPDLDRIYPAGSVTGTRCVAHLPLPPPPSRSADSDVLRSCHGRWRVRRDMCAPFAPQEEWKRMTSPT
ncbi:unnamed protein product, partial [Iphiclides podalirius]